MAKNHPFQQVSAFAGVVALSPGGHHVCALKADGSVVCWGENASGQLGNGSTQYSNTPVAVAGLSNVTALSSGRHHSCALQANGTLMCWGDNGYGQLGDGSTRDSSVWPPCATLMMRAARLTAGP